MENLIKALQILLQYSNPDFPTHCEHDICDIDPADVSEADKAKPNNYYKETDFETYRVLTFEEGYYIVKDYEEVKTAVR